MNVIEFEQRVFDVEGVRIVIRTNSYAQVGDYSYVKSSPKGNTIADWIKTRVTPLVNGFEVVVVDGSGALPNRNTLMKNLRDGYGE